MKSEFSLETNSINVISDQERHGRARDLFWPWCGANVSLLALSYGSFFLGFGISFWQATLAALIGTVLSFLVVALSSLAGKRSNAPTLVLSRSIFGSKGNVIPGFLSYLLFVGWETVLISLATLATGNVFTRVGHIDRHTAMVIGFLIAVGLTVYGGVLGFHVIMKLQKWLTLATIILTLGYIALTASSITWSKVSQIPNGSLAGVVGATIFGITGIGLGWVNSASDYSRYLPRSVSSRSVVGWTTFGASVVPIVLVIYGALLAGTSKDLNEKIAMDPIGALTALLPTWYLIPFAIVAVLGLIGGAILDLYSSGLALVTIGLPVKRHIAASIDALIMLLGTIYIVWFASDFAIPFQGFLITLGVPVAAWSAIFVAEFILNRHPIDDAALYAENSHYGRWRWKPILVMVLATVIGWGFVTNTFATWLSWQGFFMSAIGGKTGTWGAANLGVIFALMIGFVGHYLLSLRGANSSSKSQPSTS